MVAWVTAGFRAPGLHDGSGCENLPEPVAWQEPASGWGWTTVELACETGRSAERGANPVRCAGGWWRGRLAARRWGAVDALLTVVLGLADWPPQAGIIRTATSATAIAIRRGHTAPTIGAGPAASDARYVVATLRAVATRNGSRVEGEDGRA